MTDTQAALDALCRTTEEIAKSEYRRLIDMYVLLHRAQLLVKHDADNGLDAPRTASAPHHPTPDQPVSPHEH